MIRTYGMAFPKPGARKVTLSMEERGRKRTELFHRQHGRCAACGRWMSLEPGRMDSATLDHVAPEPMGCAKNDGDDNLRVVCWKCNYEKGSKRV
jgi:5-methylcytosine-specific restriction endonuclease McrA